LERRATFKFAYLPTGCEGWPALDDPKQKIAIAKSGRSLSSLSYRFGTCTTTSDV
jgi:hypothetical protein